MSFLIKSVGGYIPAAVILAFAIILPTVLGLYVLGPISRAAGKLKAPTRFLLSDFLWLVIQFQFVLGYCVQYVGIQQKGFFVSMLAALSFTVATTWAGAVSFVSRAGVTRPTRRIAFVLFHLPATLAVMIGASFVTLILFMLQTKGLSDELRAQLEYLLMLMGMGQIQFVGVLVVAPIAAWTLRRVAMWILETGVQSSSVPAMSA